MRGLVIEEDIRPMSEFRSGMATFIKQVDETGRPLVITQHGKGVGVLLSVREYQAMQEKIEMLEDIQTSISQLAEGKGLDHGVAKSLVLESLRD